MSFFSNMLHLQIWEIYFLLLCPVSVHLQSSFLHLTPSAYISKTHILMLLFIICDVQTSDFTIKL